MAGYTALIRSPGITFVLYALHPTYFGLLMQKMCALFMTMFGIHATRLKSLQLSGFFVSETATVVHLQNNKFIIIPERQCSIEFHV